MQVSSINNMFLIVNYYVNITVSNDAFTRFFSVFMTLLQDTRESILSGLKNGD